MVVPTIGDVAEKGRGMQPTRAGTTQYDLVIIGIGRSGRAVARRRLRRTRSPPCWTWTPRRNRPGPAPASDGTGLSEPARAGPTDGRGVAQARKFGVEILARDTVVSLKCPGHHRLVTLDDGSEVAAESVMIRHRPGVETLDVRAWRAGGGLDDGPP